jgi:hypothetical protein
VGMRGMGTYMRMTPSLSRARRVSTLPGGSLGNLFRKQVNNKGAIGENVLKGANDEDH